jgi:hypothetical protein
MPPRDQSSAGEPQGRQYPLAIATRSSWGTVGRTAPASITILLTRAPSAPALTEGWLPNASSSSSLPTGGPIRTTHREPGWSLPTTSPPPVPMRTIHRRSCVWAPPYQRREPEARARNQARTQRAD